MVIQEALKLVAKGQVFSYDSSVDLFSDAGQIVLNKTVEEILRMQGQPDSLSFDAVQGGLHSSCAFAPARSL